MRQTVQEGGEFESQFHNLGSLEEVIEEMRTSEWHVTRKEEL